MCRKLTLARVDQKVQSGGVEGGAAAALEELQLRRADECLRSMARAELSVRVGDVAFDRRGADREVIRDLLVSHSRGNQSQDLQLARRQLMDVARRRGGG